MHEKAIKQLARLFLCAVSVALLSNCAARDEDANTTATTTVSPPVAKELTLVSRPERIREMMRQRGEQDQAEPVLRIISPANNATINGSTVEVKLALSGDLKGFKPGKDPQTDMGNHIHVILDNQPYEAYYDLTQPFELRNVTEGRHTLRVFPSRPWHESYKNEGAFQIVTFTVKRGGDASKPTTTNRGETMASPANSPAANASPSPDREGKDVASTNAGDIDLTKPLLTYSRPKGDYSGADADPIMSDFWLVNARLQGQGGEYRVRYTIDGMAPGFIDVWNPIWLSGWTTGKHTVKLELIDKNGQVVENGGYNSATREINVIRP